MLSTLPEIIDILVDKSGVLIEYDEYAVSSTTTQRLRGLLAQLQLNFTAVSSSEHAPEHEQKHLSTHHQLLIDVGKALDLSEVCDRLAISPPMLFEQLSQVTFDVEIMGFSPGFPYLTGLPSTLQLPRKSSPRLSVPAGSFAIASQYTTVYPNTSPGGWYILGRCDVSLFDINNTPPNLISLGDTVSFTFNGLEL